MNIDDHPDLQDLRLSKKDEREARAVARAQARQATGTAAGPSFARRHRGAILAVGVVVALVVVIAVMDRAGGTGVTTTSPSTTRTDVDVRPRVDLSQPFVATPAAGWADGEQGIVAPAAAQVGSYSPQEVAAAYERVRQVVITARLNRAVIEGHDYQPYLNLLAPDAQTQFRAELDQGKPDAYSWATRVADGFHLLPVEPKVLGEMSAEQNADGALLIHTNYVFAYAFDPGRAEITTVMDLVAVDHEWADYVITNSRWEPSSQGLWPSTVRTSGYSMACHLYKNGQLAPAFGERVLAEGPGYDEKLAFDPKAPFPKDSNCPD